MDRLKEIEFLTDLKGCSIGNSAQNKIWIFCPRLTAAEGKKNTFTAEIEIRIEQTPEPGEKRLTEIIFEKGEMSSLVRQAIYNAYNKGIEQMISEKREQLKNLLGLDKKPDNPEDYDVNRVDEEGGAT